MSNIIRANKLALKVEEVECLEWSNVSEENQFDTDEKLYKIIFHMKSGKQYTRRVIEKQLGLLIDQLKGDENELE